MRRKAQQMSQAECEEILCAATSGTLAVLGDEGYPYAVPLSYVYTPGKLFFHCAKAGHKLDAIAGNDKASFCVIAQDQILPEKFTTAYKSVIVFGRTRILEGEEKLTAIRTLADKYSPNMEEAREEEIKGALDRMCLVELAVEHMTGKVGKELMKKG